MEKLLQNIVRKFIKKIDTNRIELKEVKRGNSDDLLDTFVDEGNLVYHVYKIKYNFLTIGTVVTLIDESKKIKYLSNIDIIAPFRSFGIGTYILKRYFSGYYIMADNSRASQLYARLGRAYNKFTHKEFEEFIRMCGMHGVYKLDSISPVLRRSRKKIASFYGKKDSADATIGNNITLKRTRSKQYPDGFKIYLDIIQDKEKIGEVVVVRRSKEYSLGKRDVSLGFRFKPGKDKKALISYIKNRYFK